MNSFGSLFLSPHEYLGKLNAWCEIAEGYQPSRSAKDNNRSERLQGSYRARIKTLRGLDTLESGQRYLDGGRLPIIIFATMKELAENRRQCGQRSSFPIPRGWMWYGAKPLI